MDFSAKDKTTNTKIIVKSEEKHRQSQLRSQRDCLQSRRNSKPNFLIPRSKSEVPVITADYIKEKNISLFKGNCLDIMPCIDDKSIDLILCDLPYGVTKNK